MALTTAWITDQTAFRGLADEWDEVLPADSRPFDQFAWNDVWWDSFGGPTGLEVCTVRRDGRLVGVQTLHQVGGGLANFVNYHAGVTRPLAADPEAMEGLIAAFLDRRVPLLHYGVLEAGGAPLAAIEAAARSRRDTVQIEPGAVSPLVDTKGEFETWMKGNKAKWKSRIARYRRKMERDHEASFEIGAVPEDIDGWLRSGFELEAAGWKGEGGTAILSHPETTKYYTDMAHRFGERGNLRLHRIRLDGELVAFSLCLLENGRLYSLKVGYDESRKKIVPGLVLQLAIIEWCFAEGLDAYELLGEMSDWKDKVATGTRAHVDLRIFSPTISGRLRSGYRAHLRPPLRAAYRRARGRSD